MITNRRTLLAALALAAGAALAQPGTAQAEYNLTLCGASPGGLWSLLGAGVDNALKQEFMHSLGADHVLDYTRTDYTKTGVDRVVELCPRALDCLKRQLALRARLKLAGKVAHEKIFCHPDDSAFHDLQVQWKR